MTMPAERTRALMWASEFLQEIQSSESAPEKLKQQARFILRHYPDSEDIAHTAKTSRAGDWLAPVDNPGDWR
jgi:hypothetical protein